MKRRHQGSVHTQVMPPLRRRRERLLRSRLLIPVVLVVALLLVVLIVFSQRTQDQTSQALGEVADPLAQICKTDPSVRARVGTACDTAQRVVEQGPPGPAGETGPAGRGIISTTVIDGELVVLYTDGARENLGRIVGTDGTQGAGITGADIIGSRLVLTFSDGRTRDVGEVVGPSGPTGSPGAAGAAGEDGRGVANVEQQNGRLLVTYTDGTSQDVGPLPTGPPGQDGSDGSPADSLVLKGVGPLGGDLTCTRSGGNPVAPVYTCS